MPELITNIEAAVNQHTNTIETETPDYQFIRPFGPAADGLIETITNPAGRLKFGIRDIDLMTRGIGRGELCFVTGRAHSGKTQLVLQAICNNAHGRFLYFTPDEVSELVLMKLASITRGMSSEQIEQAVEQRDEDTIKMLKDVATIDFPNLIVLDDGINFGDMKRAMEEAEHYWGGPCDGIFIDYLELLPGDADHDGVAWKVQELKRFTKAMNVPVICLHQGKRGDRGQAKGMDGMRYGGENEATFVMEVFRKSQDESLDSFERQREQKTITVGVVKNKRPPCKTGYVDLFIHPDWGAIRPLQEGDRYIPNDPNPPTPPAPVAATQTFQPRQGETVRQAGGVMWAERSLPTEPDEEF